MGGARRDEGFSLLEVMFAAFIAFFVLTSLFAVLVTSSGQGRIASMDTMATDLAQLVVEQARALPYESIGTTDADPGVNPAAVVGSLAASETTTFHNYTFAIGREVVWISDPLSPSGSGSHDYKQLTIRVSWKGGHATPVVTYIRDRTNESPIPPLVDMFAPSPNSVLFIKDGQTWSYDPATDTSVVAGSIQASASVSDPDALTVTRLQFYVNKQPVPNPVWEGNVPHTGLWPKSPEVPAYPMGWIIDLEQEVDDTKLFHEGLNIVEVYATASNLGYAYRTLLVMVDNEAPEFPDGATLTLSMPDRNLDRFRSSLTMTWTPAMDETSTAAPLYETWVSSDGGSTWPVAQRYPVRDLGSEGESLLASMSPPGFSPQPFTPYQVMLRPRSVRGLAGGDLYSNVMSSPMRLTSIVYNMQTLGNVPRYYFRLSVTPPQPDAATFASLMGGTGIEYHLWKRSAVGYVYPGYGNLPGATEQALAPGTDLSAPTDVFTDQLCNYYLQVEARVAGTGKSVWSNVIGNVPNAPQKGGLVKALVVNPTP